MVESRDEVPATPQGLNGEPVNWADLVDYEETKASGKLPAIISSAPTVIPVLRPSEQTVHIEYNSDGDKVEIEYRINTDTNKKEKVITTYRQEKKLVLRSVAARKRLPKFGASSKDDAGPNKATTQISHEEIHMKFISTRDTSQIGGEEELKKLQIGDKLIACRHCGATTHLSAQCTLKSQMEQYKTLSQEMSGQKKTGSVEPTASGSYVPPSLRNKGAGGAGGSSMMARNDQNCIRVSNLPDFVDEAYLKELFKKYGFIERVFLAKDRNTQVSKGFAFVTYKDRSAAEAAIAGFNRHRLDYLILSVEWAQPSNR